MLDSLTRMKHIAYFRNILYLLAKEKDNSNDKLLPYLVLIECDDRSDYNLTFISN